MFGTAQGETYGIRRFKGNEVLLKYSDATTNYAQIYFTRNSKGELNLKNYIPNFAPRKRPWYKAAIKAGKHTWTPIFADILSESLIISAVYEDLNSHHTSAAKGEGQLLTSVAIAALPPELVADLKHAILSVDLDLIANQVEKIRSHNGGLADAIAQCIDNFLYDKILQLINYSNRQGS